MIAFIDSSVLLRRLLGEKGALKEWNTIRTAYVSRLLMLEVGRVIDRLRLGGDIDDEGVVQLHDDTRRALASAIVVPVSERILRRAQGPMPTTLGSLDAIHLASALEVAATVAQPPKFATHDAQLARAARASGLVVCGV